MYSRIYLLFTEITFTEQRVIIALLADFVLYNEEGL